MTDKSELAKSALKALSEIEETVKMEDIIKDNKIEFAVEDKIYRVRKPERIEKSEIEQARRKEYLKMISDDTYLFKKQWIEKYKAKGINIEEKETKIKLLYAEVEKALLRLAVVVEPKDIDLLKKEVEKLRDEMHSISIEVTNLLSYSIEEQLLLHTTSYTTYLVFEIKSGEQWKRVFSAYDDLLKAEDKATELAFYYINYLVYYGAGHELTNN